MHTESDGESEYHSFSEDSEPEHEQFFNALENFEREVWTLDCSTTVTEEEQTDSTKPISSYSDLTVDFELPFDQTTVEEEETEGMTSSLCFP